MIKGIVTTDREPVVQLTARSQNGDDVSFEAVVDTGFTGWLTLPPDIILALGLSWKELGSAVLADVSLIDFDVYDAQIF